MVGDGPNEAPKTGWSGIEHDDLAALGFVGGTDVDPEVPEVSVLEVLAEYAPADASECADDTDTSRDAEDDVHHRLFSVTNPPGTVTVTTFIDGRIQQIELSPKASDMTETDLAEEIVVIAGLATQEARSAQHELMLEGMREQGHDDVATRDFLTRDLDLPTPQQVESARAEVFATRYVGEND